MGYHIFLPMLLPGRTFDTQSFANKIVLQDSASLLKSALYKPYKPWPERIHEK